MVALFAAARTPDAFAAIDVAGEMPSTFDEIVQSPEKFSGGSQALFCQGLRSTLDISELVALAEPVKVRCNRLGVLR